MHSVSKSPIIINRHRKSSHKPMTTRNTGRATRLPTNRPPTHPGEMLLEEFLKPLGISQSDFSLKLGVSFQRLNEIINAKRGITPDTALRLEKVLGMSADFWLGLQIDWDLWQTMHSTAYEKIDLLEPVNTKG
jgi:addiction module HigA family antidote